MIIRFQVLRPYIKESNTTLQAISLENPRVSTEQEEHVGHMARMLAVNSGLRVLKLGKSAVRDLGVETLVAYGVCANDTLEVRPEQRRPLTVCS